jgi:diguanylate cyclase (GGDEF)-like protein/PAS domain S-box-containing protein
LRAVATPSSRVTRGSGLWAILAAFMEGSEVTEGSQPTAGVGLGEFQSQAQAILDQAHDAVVAMDAGGFVIGWNAQAESTFGWTKDEAVGKVLADLLIPPQYRDAHWTGLQRFLDTGEGPVIDKRLELSALHRDGHEFPVELTISAIQLGERWFFNAFLHDITDRKRAERLLRAQHKLTEALAEADTIEEAMPNVLEALGSSMGWQLGAHWTPSETGDELRCRAVWQENAVATSGFRELSLATPLPRGVGLPGRVWASGKPAWIRDVTADPNFPRAPGAVRAGLHAGICLPIEGNERFLGTIEFFSSSIRDPDEELIEMMTAIGAQISRFVTSMIERGELLSELGALAHTDDLTGLPNRRAWEDALRHGLARARRSRRPFCIAILDLDSFKAYNDEHGHQAGDALLQAAADLWSRALRGGDLIARYGGEEFSVLLENCASKNARVVVERIRKETPSGQTCSAGIAQWDAAESVDELVSRADAALYAAKREGRDRTVVAGASATQD